MKQEAIKNGILVQDEKGTIWEVVDERPSVQVRLVGPPALDVRKQVFIEEMEDWKLGGSRGIEARVREEKERKQLARRAVLSRSDVMALGQSRL